MEMISSFRGDKDEFYLVVIKFKHVRSCPSFGITYITILNSRMQLNGPFKPFNHLTVFT